MNAIAWLNNAAWVERIGWSLVDSFWQIGLVAAVYCIMAFAMRHRTANARYLLGFSALAAMVALPVTTWSRTTVSPQHSARAPIEVAAPSAVESSNRTDLAEPNVQRFKMTPSQRSYQSPLTLRSVLNWRRVWEPTLPWLTACWLAGATLLAIRPIYGLAIVRRLKTRGRRPVHGELLQRSRDMMRRMQMDTVVDFAESALVEVPTVVAYLRPVVLLPIATISGLTPGQLDCIVAHELAHIRRHDYLVNLAQTVIEALLFYHPCMWWVSSQVRRERENCCDDVAMSICGNPSDYVRALYALESSRPTAAPAVAATGGSLLNRARRLLTIPQARSSHDHRAPWLAGLIVLAMVAAVVSFGASHAEETSHEQNTATNQLENTIGDSFVHPKRVTQRVEQAPAQPAEQKAPEIDELDEDGFSQLHRAASGGHLSRVKALLQAEANANVSQATFHGTPLQYAAAHGHVDTVAALLEGGATVDSRDANGRTPLVWAAMNGHTDVIRRLLDDGADIQATNSGGWSPLHYAADHGHEAAAQLLIDRGARTDVENARGQTPLDVNPSLNVTIPAEVEGAGTKSKSPTRRQSTAEPVATPKSEGNRDVESSQHDPMEVVAEFSGKAIRWRDIAPPPEWYVKRAEYQRKNGHTLGYEKPGDYPLSRLQERIINPLIDEYRKNNETEPTEQEIQEMMVHQRQASALQKEKSEQELADLNVQLDELRSKRESPNLSEWSRSALERKIVQLERRIDVQQQSLAVRKEQTPEAERFFAQWFLGNFKLQQSLYKKYGGRAIWQQAGPEALDAMRDYLKEKESSGAFKIHDRELQDRFWKYYTNDRMHTFADTKVFEQSLSQYLEAANAKNDRNKK